MVRFLQVFGFVFGCFCWLSVIVHFDFGCAWIIVVQQLSDVKQKLEGNFRGVGESLYARNQN